MLSSYGTKTKNIFRRARSGCRRNVRQSHHKTFSGLHSSRMIILYLLLSVVDVYCKLYNLVDLLKWNDVSNLGSRSRDFWPPPSPPPPKIKSFLAQLENEPAASAREQIKASPTPKWTDNFKSKVKRPNSKMRHPNLKWITFNSKTKPYNKCNLWPCNKLQPSSDLLL